MEENTSGVLFIRTADEVYKHMKAELAKRENQGTKVVPMTRDQTEIMIALTMMGDEKQRALYKQIRDDLDSGAASPLLRIMVGRIEAAHQEARDRVELGVWLFLGVSLDRPGTAVMTAAFIHGWLNAHPGEYCTMQSLVYDFPFGMPGEELWHEVWDAQKKFDASGMQPDNYLDYASAWGVPNNAVHAAAAEG